jgi:hypothetical protein
MINHEKIKNKTYREGYKTGFKRGYAKCKKDIISYFTRKYQLVDIDKMTSDVAKEFGQE